MSVNIENEREIQPMQLSIEQLSSLRKQHEEEIQELQGQMKTLHDAKNRFLNARSTLDDMKTSEPGNALLVPLNSSLYVPGTIQDSSKVMVELGTGYFAEKSVDEAKELIDRKLTLLAKSLESIESVGNNKKKNIEQLGMVLEYKVSQAQQQQGGK